MWMIIAALFAPGLALFAPNAKPAKPATPVYTVKYTDNFDLDGDGQADPVSLEYMKKAGCERVVLVAGRFRLPFDHQFPVYLDGKKPPTRETMPLKFVRLDPTSSAQAIYIDKHHHCDHDYYNATDLLYGQHIAAVFALKDGQLQRIWWNAPYDPRISFRGDGSWEYEEIECVRDARYSDRTENGWDSENPIVVKWGLEKRTLLRMRYRNGKVSIKKEKVRHLRSGCSESGRYCPFVYVGEHPQLMGEVLRDQVGVAAWAEDQLPVAHTAGEILTLHLVERKPGETTHLDAIWVEVDGQLHHPIGCFDQPWCTADGQLHSMRLGDALVLQFGPLPAGEASVYAVGYYDNDRQLAWVERRLIGQGRSAPAAGLIGERAE